MRSLVAPLPTLRVEFVMQNKILTVSLNYFYFMPDIVRHLYNNVKVKISHADYFVCFGTHVQIKCHRAFPKHGV